MTSWKRMLATTIALGWLAAPWARAEEPAPPAEPAGPSAGATGVEPAAQLPGVLVTAPREEDTLAAPLTTRAPELDLGARTLARDGSDLLDAAPGVAVNRNGPLTGIVQVRGLAGDRVKTLVDDMTITPACSNHMDPPLHYVIPSTVDSLRAVAGVTPVSLGGDSIAGTVIADPERPVFAEDEPIRLTARGSARFSGDQNAWGFAGTTGAAGENASLSYTGSWHTGEDIRLRGGRVRASGFEVQQHGLLLAGRADGLGVFSLDGGIGRTDYAGTPALMMDVVDDSSEHFGARWTGALGGIELEARAYWHTIDHVMDNFTLRPNAGTMENPRSRSPAESRDAGYRLGASIPLVEGHVARIGSDMNLASFESTIRNLTTGQEQTGIPDAERNRIGVYAEWEARWTDRWQTLVGVREDTVWSSAGEVARTFMPMSMMAQQALAADKAAFNAGDRSLSDANWEAVGLVRFQPAAGQRYELGLARKARAPSMLERYQWTPLSASAGMADGRLYQGNLDLESEVAYQVALTGSWSGERWQLEISPFYTHVTDYIQGSPVPGRMDPMTGNPILRWENFENVNLYGVDARAGYTWNEHVGLRGNLSFVRGRNDTTDDDLYRIMPLHGAVDLDLAWGRLSGVIEMAYGARQEQVARYNAEQPTAGWVTLNLSAGYELREGAKLEIGVENLLNQDYALHTSGVNQVRLSDVARGDRIPEAGRFFWTGVTLEY